MDPTPLIGIGLALAALLAAMLLEGSDPLAVLLLAPMLLVFGATIGVGIAGATAGDVGRLGSWLRMGLAPAAAPAAGQRIQLLSELAGRARREGLLALDGVVGRLPDPFLRRGLQLAIDGAELDHLRAVLEREIAARAADGLLAARLFERMGSSAPTIGIIGTVIGLIHVLADLSSPARIGPLIAAAFVATLWGVLTANVLWLPMSRRITRTVQLRRAELDLLLTGIAEIHAGTSPRAVRQRLTALLPPGRRAAG